METVLITGSQGFIGSYVCSELLEHGYQVIGIDNYSKYGMVARRHDSHPNFKLHNTDVIQAPSYIYKDADYIIAGAAMIGGIEYFHKYAYDLLATNERIMAATFDQAIDVHRDNRCPLKRIVVLSSSMVFENTSVFPTPEPALRETPPPSSTYGFQKLASEYFAKGAYEQYGLPYTIVRPFNCIGIGEEPDFTGHNNMALSHVVPDFVYRALTLSPRDEFNIYGTGEQVRHYTNGKDIARGIRKCMESPMAHNEDFNISHPDPTDVKELACMIWQKIHGGTPTFKHLPPFEYDVQYRSPDVLKAERLLDFRAEISLSDSLDEVIEWIKNYSQTQSA
jgi:nucleoside-diphosphate-sugar epimerase